jgi:hydrogenase 3 maturation protease
VSLATQLAGRLTGRVVVMGIGNPLRGDDGAGSRLAESLLDTAGVLVIDAEEVPENHLGRVVQARPDRVLLVDAVDLGATPGTVALLSVDELRSYAPSTHRVPLAVLADFLGKATGAEVLLLAVQPGRNGFGAGLTAEVEGSVSALATLLGALLPGACGRSGSEQAGSVT